MEDISNELKTIVNAMQTEEDIVKAIAVFRTKKALSCLKDPVLDSKINNELRLNAGGLVWTLLAHYQDYLETKK